MGKEIERKYLVSEMDWQSMAHGAKYIQGYLSLSMKAVVRVRINGEKGFISIKGENKGAARTEFEYQIPLSDANQILEELSIRPYIEKTRYKIKHANLDWDVDVFYRENEGLVLAEVELESEHQNIELPPWVTIEVTANPRYYNSNLVKNPYKTWNKLET